MIKGSLNNLNHSLTIKKKFQMTLTSIIAEHISCARAAAATDEEVTLETGDLRQEDYT